MFENFIKAFLDAIEVDVAPKQIIRIGSKSADKKRPVKVILNNADDKEKIMSNLRKLKDADDNIRGISVREDYTQEERKLIQAMHEEEKRKNEADNVTHWKVRGTPKNGLRVVRITTRNYISSYWVSTKEKKSKQAIKTRIMCKTTKYQSRQTNSASTTRNVERQSARSAKNVF